MSLLLEGALEFSCRNGLVHVVDQAGQRVSISLDDFRAALPLANEFWAKWRLRQIEGGGTPIIRFRRGDSPKH